jgi:hypothetical protein
VPVPIPELQVTPEQWDMMETIIREKNKKSKSKL